MPLGSSNKASLLEMKRLKHLPSAEGDITASSTRGSSRSTKESRCYLQEQRQLTLGKQSFPTSNQSFPPRQSSSPQQSFPLKPHSAHASMQTDGAESTLRSSSSGRSSRRSISSNRYRDIQAAQLADDEAAASAETALLSRRRRAGGGGAWLLRGPMAIGRDD